MKGFSLFFSLFLISLVSCNIQPPLENIYNDANISPLPIIKIKSDQVFISISGLFNNNTKIDSVVSKTLDIFSFSLQDSTLGISVIDKKKKLHKADFYNDGRFVTIIVYYDNFNNLNNNSSNITSGRFINGRVLFDFKHKPDELLVFWQNVEIPESYMKFSNGGFSVLIPKEAKTVESSYIRIFGISDNCETTDLRVTLVYGIPVMAEK